MDSDALIVSAGLVFFNTNLAAAVATLTTMIFTWLRYGKPDVSMTFNASLAGLVGITAGCDAVSPFVPSARSPFTAYAVRWARSSPACSPQASPR